MNSKRIGLIVATVIAVVAWNSASAQWAVFDGANFGENIAKYTLAAQAHLTQLYQWENQIIRQEMMYEQTIGNTFAAANDMVDSATSPYYMLVDQASADINNLANIKAAAGDIQGTLEGGLQVSQDTATDLTSSGDQLRWALQEAEQGGSSRTAQLHAQNQLAAVQASIQEAQAQDIAAMLDQKLAAEQMQQQLDQLQLQDAQNTQYLPIQNTSQGADQNESICASGSTNPYCNWNGSGPTYQ